MARMRHFIKTALCAAVAIVSMLMLSAASFADSGEKAPIKQLGTYGQQARIADYDNCLTDSEETELLEILQKSAKSAKCNIGVVITRDLEGKSDKGYADAFLDDNFGYTSNSIVLMMLNSYNLPKYAGYKDWISTEGAVKSRVQPKIDKIFDKIYDKMGEPIGNKYAYNNSTKTYGGYDYYAAVKEFARNARRYGSGGLTRLGVKIWDFITNNFMFFAGGVAMSAVIMLSVTTAITRGYKRKATLSASNYLDRRATRVTRQVDRFVREYTTSHTHSSSSGGHGGGGHHSGGGHGGGGGRHR